MESLHTDRLIASGRGRFSQRESKFANSPLGRGASDPTDCQGDHGGQGSGRETDEDEPLSRHLDILSACRTGAPTLRLPAGAYRRVGTDDWLEIAALYEAHAAVRNGALVRPERWWTTQIMRNWPWMS